MKINTELLWVLDLYQMGRALVRTDNVADGQNKLLLHFIKGMNASDG